MESRARLRSAATVVALAAIAASTCVALPAQAASRDETPIAGTYASAPMSFRGYDSSVAEAHGYRIVTNSDGRQTSVPVSAEARRQAVLDNVAPGDCGSSFVNAAKLSNDTLAVTTGYKVPFTVAEKTWRVNAVSVFSSHTFPWDGPSGGAWSAQAAATLVGPGVAVVPLTAHVVVVNGRVCYSAGPTASFG
ncbi:hypothetical protein DOU17_10190 [Clavibacter michiganensis subsp. michiganensis]|uniref:Secreted protein n=2 Tax=Clavibacter michiganensis TaxID=28447 RepID=A5CN27_CLAM3|nr:hypothetical protein [Clavibacter michiganensis]MBE3078436.1 hypothetical protein [Clavibacter michiganensis subsp. michiganensis]MBW8025962.1 hypothetical protein [Clavibacter michiganensis subsp. michiganensis]MDO4026906.1 hypothetical protein [Clavibacter michiganensis]MDO4036256.1 hypothetical protein [Clavibacter michiganensis]MDO4048398.1 hypothetical protein [Clavibacter michiganensis]